MAVRNQNTGFIKVYQHFVTNTVFGDKNANLFSNDCYMTLVNFLLLFPERYTLQRQRRRQQRVAAALHALVNRKVQPLQSDSIKILHAADTVGCLL